MKKLESSFIENHKKGFLNPIGIKKVDRMGMQVFTFGNLNLTLKYEKSASLNSGLFTEKKGIVVDTTWDIIKEVRCRPSDFDLLKDLSLTLQNSTHLQMKEFFKGQVFVKKHSNEVNGSMFCREKYTNNEIIALTLPPNSILGLLVLFHEVGHSQTYNSQDSTYVSEKKAWNWALKKIKPFIQSLNITRWDINLIVKRYYLASYT